MTENVRATYVRRALVVLAAFTVLVLIGGAAASSLWWEYGKPQHDFRKRIEETYGETVVSFEIRQGSRDAWVDWSYLVHLSVRLTEWNTDVIEAMAIQEVPRFLAEHPEEDLTHYDIGVRVQDEPWSTQDLALPVDIGELRESLAFYPDSVELGADVERSKD